MNNMQFMILVLVLALATALTRVLPFLIFGEADRPPAMVEYLGKVLPAAMMGLLVVYCFKDIDVSDAGAVLPSVAASAAVVAVHLIKRSTMLSILAGTAVYMVLIRVF